MTASLLKGLAIGFCIAAPVGPIGVLCIRRSMAHGWRIGFSTGLGAATADALYGGVAAFGLTAVTTVLTAQQSWLGAVGGVVLIWLGWRTLRSTPPTPDQTGSTVLSSAAAYSSTVLLTLANPATIISFGAVFATWGFATASYWDAAWLTLGVLVGSAAWWLLLSGASGFLRTRLSFRTMRWVNVISGVMLAGFGAFALIRLAK
jgi:threonine/homoserine/homoserine lactone efflux protein